MIHLLELKFGWYFKKAGVSNDGVGNLIVVIEA